MKTLMVVFLLGNLTFAQSSVPMPGKGHKKVFALVGGAIVLGTVSAVVWGSSSTRIPVKGSPIKPVGPQR